MHSKRIRTLCLAGLFVAQAAGCNGLHTRLSDRLRKGDPGVPGVARLDSTGSAGTGQFLDEPAHTPIPAPPSASGGERRAAKPSDSGGDRGTKVDPPVDPRIAARALLDDLGARVTEDETGEVVAIDLAETGVTDEDLQQIAVFSHVRELNLRGTIVSDAGLAAISDLPNVEFLGLTGTRVSDTGLARLGKLERLRFLTLGHTSVSDAGLSTIVRWTRLEGLNVKATQVTELGAARLHRQLPKCRVIVDSRTSDTDRRDSSRPPTLPRRLPEHRGETESDAPDASNPVPGSTGGELDIEQDWESDAATPTSAVPAVDPQQRLMFVLRQKLEDPDVLKAIAEVQLSRQQPNEALRLLEAAAERVPEDRELRYVLGVTRARCGDYEGACNEFALAVGDAAAHHNLGVLLHEAGDDPGAIREFQRALRCEPGFRAAREWLAALTLPEGAAANVADSPLLSDEEIRSLILQWSDRRTPPVQTTPRRLEGAPPRLEAVYPVVEPTSPHVEAAAPHVENAARVEPELYPRFGTQAAAEVQTP